MKLLRLLHVVSELAPFTGDSALAQENRFLSRALAELGVEVTIAVPGYAVPEAGRVGLARRLSPVSVPATPTESSGDEHPTQEVIIYEGSATGGRVAIVVIDVPAASPGGQPRVEALSAALEIAKARGEWPDVVLAGPGTEAALALAKASGSTEFPAPATLYSLRSVEHDSVEVRDALAHADRVLVNSPTWADALRQTIAENPASGVRIVRLLGSVRDAIRGVTPGIDSITWNPRQDRYLIADFPRDPLVGKAHHKKELQRELGLRAPTEDTPLVAVLGPLDPNILDYTAVNELAKRKLQLVVLADSERDGIALRHLKRLLYQTPGKVAVPTFADAGERAAFEHRLLAAADFALLAHNFSPETLCELYCMHYGAVPIAPKSGSFADILVEFDTHTATGNGFLFLSEGDSEHLMSAVNRALQTYAQQESFAVQVQRVMEADLSWRTAAQRYVNIIMDLLREMERLAA